MNGKHRWGYRWAQYWLAVKGKPSSQGLASAKKTLTPTQFDLFQTLQLSEQAHAINVMQQLQALRHSDADLMQAALLHDVGKAKYPLRLYERVWIVVGQAFFPKLVLKWGEAQPKGFKRAFVVAAQHPQWGAEMAAAADSNFRVVTIIREHQADLPENMDEAIKQKLMALKAVDDEN